MKKYIIGSFSIAALILIVSFVSSASKTTEASVTQGSEYKSVITGPSQTNASVLQSAIIATSSGNGVSLVTPGYLGSVILTGTSTGLMNIYDASTSDSTKRTLTATTSLRLIAQFTPFTGLGSYPIDASFYNGLVVEFVGPVATTTITYRQY